VNVITGLFWRGKDSAKQIPSGTLLYTDPAQYEFFEPTQPTTFSKDRTGVYGQEILFMLACYSKENMLLYGADYNYDGFFSTIDVGIVRLDPANPVRNMLYSTENLSNGKPLSPRFLVDQLNGDIFYRGRTSSGSRRIFKGNTNGIAPVEISSLGSNIELLAVSKNRIFFKSTSFGNLLTEGNVSSIKKDGTDLISHAFKSVSFAGNADARAIDDKLYYFGEQNTLKEFDFDTGLTRNLYSFSLLKKGFITDGFLVPYPVIKVANNNIYYSLGNFKVSRVKSDGSSSEGLTVYPDVRESGNFFALRALAIDLDGN
jgi:hypothetical protein